MDTFRAASGLSQALGSWGTLSVPVLGSQGSCPAGSDTLIGYCGALGAEEGSRSCRHPLEGSSSFSVHGVGSCFAGVLHMGTSQWMDCTGVMIVGRNDGVG